MKRATSLRVLVPALLASLVFSGARALSSQQEATPAGAAPAANAPERATTTETDLLALAFDSVSRMPDVPHLKNRSRAQERVVAAWLASDEPLLADEAAREIGNWRRARALASVGCYYARHDDAERARAALELAARACEEETPNAKQAWRVESMRARIAEGWLLLGVDEEQEPVLNLTSPEGAEVAAVYAERGPDSLVPRLFELAREAANSRQLEPARGALGLYRALYERCRSDPDRRQEVASGVEECVAIVPPDIAVTSFLGLGEVEAEAGELELAAGWVGRAQKALEEAHLSAEMRVPLLARVARGWVGAGDEAPARELLTRALAEYDAGRRTIVDIYRAGVLIPIAEGFGVLGEFAKSESVYMRSLYESEENPNGRPRAENLAAVCISLATQRHRPAPELEVAIRRLAASLSEPW